MPLSPLRQSAVAAHFSSAWLLPWPHITPICWCLPFSSFSICSFYCLLNATVLRPEVVGLLGRQHLVYGIFHPHVNTVYSLASFYSLTFVPSLSHILSKQTCVCVCALGELQGCFWPCSKEEESGWTLFAIIGQQRPSLLYFKRLLSHLSYKRTAVLKPFTRLSSVFNTHLFKEKIPDHSWSLPEEHLTKWVCLPLQFGLYFVWKASNADKKCIMLLGLLWRKQ